MYGQGAYGIFGSQSSDTLRWIQCSVEEISERFINTIVKEMLYDKNIPFIDGKRMYDFIYITNTAKMFYFIGLYGKARESYYIGNLFVRPYN